MGHFQGVCIVTQIDAGQYMQEIALQSQSRIPANYPEQTPYPALFCR